MWLKKKYLLGNILLLSVKNSFSAEGDECRCSKTARAAT